MPLQFHLPIFARPTYCSRRSITLSNSCTSETFVSSFIQSWLTTASLHTLVSSSIHGGTSAIFQYVGIFVWEFSLEFFVGFFVLLYFGIFVWEFSLKFFVGFFFVILYFGIFVWEFSLEVVYMGVPAQFSFLWNNLMESDEAKRGAPPATERSEGASPQRLNKVRERPPSD